MKPQQALTCEIKYYALIYCTIINYYDLQCVINQGFGTTVCNNLLHTAYSDFEYTAKTGVGGV